MELLAIFLLVVIWIWVILIDSVVNKILKKLNEKEGGE